MLDDKWERIEEIFLEAADVPLSDRADLLDRMCGGDSEIRAEVESFFARIPTAKPQSAQPSNLKWRRC